MVPHFLEVWGPKTNFVSTKWGHPTPLVIFWGYSFLHAYLSNQPGPGDQGTRDGSPWPMPMPYPDVFRGGGSGASLWKKRRASFEILILNWFTLGRPSSCPTTLWLGRRLSAAQWRVVRSLEDRSEDLNSVLEVDAGAMARAAVKTESAGDQLDALHRAVAQASASLHDLGSGYFGSVGTSTKFDFDQSVGFEGTSTMEAFVVAKPIVASRVPFGPPPAFDPVPYFDEETKEAYCRPLEHCLNEPRAPLPAVSVHASRAERNLLFRAMADTNRLVAISACEAGDGPFSGLVAVPKDLDRDRLILDARPLERARCQGLFLPVCG